MTALSARCDTSLPAEISLSVLLWNISVNKSCSHCTALCCISFQWFVQLSSVEEIRGYCDWNEEKSSIIALSNLELFPSVRPGVSGSKLSCWCTSAHARPALGALCTLHSHQCHTQINNSDLEPPVKNDNHTLMVPSARKSFVFTQ